MRQINETISPTPASNGDSNRHVKEYLLRYINLPHPPHYAVMLTGPWGIGKSFLIDKFLKSALKEDQRYIYVSLFGLASAHEIDAAIFRATYPLLDSKGVKIVGHLAKVAMRYVRVDPEIKIADWLSKFNAALYVFDDLERCEMDTNKVLGYINNYVEHDKCKVIIIANEAEIKKSDDYERRREKIIGRTLEVQSAFDEALTYFLSKIDDETARTFLDVQRSAVSQVYQLSSLNNLRILQQTIWDFEQLFLALSGDQRSNSIGMSVLLKLFFALSFEFKAGRIKADDLRDRVGNIVSGMMNKDKDAQPTRLSLASKRYSGLYLHDTLLSDDVLIELLAKGIVDREQIQLSISRSSYFVISSDEPAWRCVWHWVERSDSDFAHAFATMERQFSARAITEPGELLHVFGIRLWLSDANLLDKSRPEVVAEGKQYVDNLYEQKRLEPFSVDGTGELRHNGYGGLGILECKTPEYRELYQYLEDIRRRASEDQFPKHGEDLLQEMESDPQLFYRRLNYTNSDDNRFARVPVLASIDADAFAASFLRLPSLAQRTVLSAIKGRYESGMLSRELSSEKPWLAAVKDSLIKASVDLPQIGKHRAAKMIEWYLDEFLT